MTTKTVYLIVRGDGAVRIRTRRPWSSDLRLDEIAVPIKINFPSGWGWMADDAIAIDMPDPPAVEPPVGTLTFIRGAAAPDSDA